MICTTIFALEFFLFGDQIDVHEGQGQIEISKVIRCHLSYVKE